jgi:RNA polymerase sigma-70 factor, ECF subfamily
MSGFEELYRQYFDDVFRFLRGLTVNEDLAEELTEETFFKALKAIDDFKGNCDVRVWLCQIAENSYFSYIKKQKRFLTQRDLNDLVATEESIEKLLVDKELAFKLHQILHDLNEPYKEVFSLRVFGELPFKQIAILFGKTEHWACVTYHRAKEKIKKRMEELK